MSICMVLLMNLLNFVYTPPSKAFINYENLLRRESQNYINQLNKKYASQEKNLRFEIAKNDVMWIECYIPEAQRLPFSPY